MNLYQKPVSYFFVVVSLLLLCIIMSHTVYRVSLNYPGRLMQFPIMFTYCKRSKHFLKNLLFMSVPCRLGILRKTKESHSTELWLKSKKLHVGDNFKTKLKETILEIPYCGLAHRKHNQLYEIGSWLTTSSPKWKEN